MRFIILTQYYPPETGAPQNRLSDLARRLQNAGHSVQILTAKPNYPTGKFLRGYEHGWCHRSQWEGVPVTRCWLFPTASKKALLRLLNYFSFVFSAAFFGALTLRRADFLLVESPPIFLGITARFLARLKGAQMIFNVSDLYPETAVALGYLKPGKLLSLMEQLEAFCYRSAALVTGQTEGIVNSIAASFPQAETFLLTNGVDLKKFDRQAIDAKDETRDESVFTFGYAGVHGHAQKLESVLEAARLLPADSNVRLAFYGDGPLRADLEARAAQWNLTNVNFFGHCTHARVLAAMTTWDAGLVPLMNTPLMAGALPSKMFEVMAMGLPVLLSAPRGEASALLEKACGGVHVPAEDAHALAEALQAMATQRRQSQEMGGSGREYVAQHYDRETIARRFVEAVTQLQKKEAQ